MDYATKVVNIGVPNMFVPHGNSKLLKEKLGLDKRSIYDKITSIIGGNNERSIKQII
jgi:1-deoxy-D-xylulose-5-phosphate synthase